MSKSLGNVIDPLEVIHGCELQTLYSKLEQGNLAAKEVAKAKKDFEIDFAETKGHIHSFFIVFAEFNLFIFKCAWDGGALLFRVHLSLRERENRA